MPTFMYRLARVSLKVFYRLWGGLEVHGQDNVPTTGRLVVACNHGSYFDPTILGAAFKRDLHFMARRTLFEKPLFGWLITQTQAFPLNREGDSREAIRAFGERLEKNYAVVMFPEGTRSKTGALDEMKPGVGMLAVRYQSPVTPVYIWGSYQSWPRGKKWPCPHHLKVCIGKTIRPSGDSARRKEDQARITAEVDQALRELERQAWEGEGPPPSAPASGAPRTEHGTDAP